MKMSNEFADVKVSQTAKKFEFTNSPILFNILSDSLYSNKIGSIVRELASNARDAHRAAGKIDVPFKVSISSSSLFYHNQPCFSIKDYGIGLTEEEIMNIYSVYGASNKRDTNEFTGGFGIGSKSPFSYTESFNIISIVNGIKTVYCAFIDKDGFPSITKMGSSATDEGNGLEVFFAIKHSDISNFRYEIRNQLSAFSPHPDVSDAGIAPWKKEIVLEDHSDWVLLSDSGATSYYVDIDCVRYSVSTDMIKNAVPLNWGSSVVFKIGVGDVDISASRESLAYTGKTIQFLSEKMNKLADDFNSLIQRTFLSEASRWDACYKVRNTLPLVNLLRDPLKRMDGQISYAFKQIEKEIKLTEIQEFEPYLYFFNKKGKMKKVANSSFLYRVEYDYKNGTHKAILNLGGYKVFLVTKKATIKIIQDALDFGDESEGLVIKCSDSDSIEKLLKLLENPTTVNIDDSIVIPEKTVPVKKQKLYNVSIKENSRRAYIYRPFNSSFLCNWNLSGTRSTMTLDKIKELIEGPDKDSIIFVRTIGNIITTYDKAVTDPEDNNSPEVKKLIKFLNLLLEVYNNTTDCITKIVFINGETWKALSALSDINITFDTEFEKLKKILKNFKHTPNSQGVNMINLARGFAKVPMDILKIAEKISNNIGASNHHNMGKGKFQDLIKEFYYKCQGRQFDLFTVIINMADEFGIDTTKDPYYDNYLKKNPILKLIGGDSDENTYATCIETYIKD